MYCKLSGAHTRVGEISITLQSSFVEIALLHGCSPLGVLHVCKNYLLSYLNANLISPKPVPIFSRALEKLDIATFKHFHNLTNLQFIKYNENAQNG